VVTVKGCRFYQWEQPTQYHLHILEKTNLNLFSVWVFKSCTTISI